jgi:hypothetical protein
MTEKPPRGKPLSLYPLSFDEAVKALLDTQPPPPEERGIPKEDPPHPRRRKKDQAKG